MTIYLSLLSRSISDHHLRCGGWLNLEFSKREKHSGWAIKTTVTFAEFAPPPTGHSRYNDFTYENPGINPILWGQAEGFDTGYRHDSHVDNDAYWHNSRADKRRFRHDSSPAKSHATRV